MEFDSLKVKHQILEQDAARLKMTVQEYEVSIGAQKKEVRIQRIRLDWDWKWPIRRVMRLPFNFRSRTFKPK